MTEERIKEWMIRLSEAEVAWLKERAKDDEHICPRELISKLEPASKVLPINWGPYCPRCGVRLFDVILYFEEAKE